MDWLLLAIIGQVCGVLSGFLGIGGGIVLVPLLVTLGYTPIHATATSSLVVAITAMSGSLQNWRMGYFSFKRVLFLGLPALVSAQLGVYLASRIDSHTLLTGFGFLLLVNLYLVEFRKRLTIGMQRQQRSPKLKTVISTINESREHIVLAGLLTIANGAIVLVQLILFGRPIEAVFQTSLGIIINPITLIAFGTLLLLIVYVFESLEVLYLAKELQTSTNSNKQVQQQPQRFNAVIARIITGGIAGILTGLFGIGGGAILVPLQILLLNESLKVAIQTSLGVIILTAISAGIGHTLSGNVLFVQGIILGGGGLLGAQISTRYLPAIPEKVVSLAFRAMLISLSVYMAFLVYGMNWSTPHTDPILDISILSRLSLESIRLLISVQK